MTRKTTYRVAYVAVLLGFVVATAVTWAYAGWWALLPAVIGAGWLEPVVLNWFRRANHA